MKTLFTLLVFFSLSLNADEIQRIESIVQEISQLKQDYENLEKKYVKRINNLENQLNKEKNRHKTKDKIKTNNKRDLNICLDNQIIKDDNPFPKLQSKKKFQTSKKESVEFKATSFRVNKIANIYNELEGVVIDTWEDKTSFTSHTRNGKWIKITGYFIDKKWRPSEKEMWVKSCDVINRSEVTH